MKVKNRKLFETTLSIIGALAVTVLLWDAASQALDKPFLPSPALTFAAMERLASDGSLWRHLWASLSRILWAMGGSVIPAAALGLAAGLTPHFSRLISPFIYLFHPLPKAAFLPLIILFFGIGETGKVILVALTIFSQILVTLRDAAKRTPLSLIDAVRSMGGGRAAVLRHVVIPFVAPDFFTALRISMGTAIAVLFLAETFAAQNGLGYLIMDAWIRVAYDEMFAAIVTTGLLGLALYMVIDLLEAAICRWR
jgi:NitT/TauT family transport system permease protein